jgi:hypothetical protein
MRGGFFERLEKRVGGGASDLVRLVDDVDLRGQLCWGIAHFVSQIADIIDATVAGGVDLDNIRRCARIDGDTVGADVAGALRRVFRKAVDGLCEQSRRSGLACAPRPAEQKGVPDSIKPDCVLQCAHDMALANKLVRCERIRAVLAI